MRSGTARRGALDAALAEIEQGNKQPTVAWRRRFSLLLGLERLLSDEEPHLADGTVLSAHQVDALSGTLTALLAEAQRNGSGNGAANGNGTPANVNWNAGARSAYSSASPPPPLRCGHSTRTRSRAWSNRAASWRRPASPAAC